MNLKSNRELSEDKSSILTNPKNNPFTSLYPTLSKSDLLAEREAAWALSLSEALSVRHIDIYSKCFESYKEVLNLSPEKIRNIGLVKNKATFEGKDALLQKLAQVQKICKELHIKTTTILDPEYPLGLRHTYLPPTVIYYRGELAGYFPHKDTSYLAIVGTRKCDKFGEEVTFKIAEDFCTLGGHIISGLALGIDTLAHKGACSGFEKNINNQSGFNAPTTAVLGCGVDQIYPFGNRKLYHKILDLGGAILSEYIPGTLPNPYYFPARNRIIAGLSEAVLVTQAPQKSGALITVNFALEQGRGVFAYDFQEERTGKISERNAGNYQLISDGAIPITGISDIFDHQFGFLRTKYQSNVLKKEHITEPHTDTSTHSSSPNLTNVCKAISISPKTLAEISYILKLDHKAISQVIMEGILAGSIKELPGKKYYSTR